MRNKLEPCKVIEPCNPCFRQTTWSIGELQSTLGGGSGANLQQLHDVLLVGGKTTDLADNFLDKELFFEIVLRNVTGLVLVGPGGDLVTLVDAVSDVRLLHGGGHKAVEKRKKLKNRNFNRGGQIKSLGQNEKTKTELCVFF